jgi:hypothetical protein
MPASASMPKDMSSTDTSTSNSVVPRCRRGAREGARIELKWGI